MGNFLYYARVVEPTIIVALNSIASEQTNSTDATTKATTELLNYAMANSEAIKNYHKSGMILHIHSNASNPRADREEIITSARHQRIPTRPP